MKYAYVFGMHTLYGILGGVLFGEFLFPSEGHPQLLSFLGACAYGLLSWDSIRGKIKDHEARTGR